MTLKQLIDKKAANLSAAPEDFFSGVDEFQLFIYHRILELISNLEKRGGKLVKSTANLKIALKIRDELEKVLSGREYMEVIASFAKQFDIQKKITDKFFEKAFSDFKNRKVDDLIFTQSKEAAINLLTDATPQTDFLNSISSQIRTAISTESSWAETVSLLKGITLGDQEKDGKLLKYVKQIASDAFAISDRSYTNAVAQSLEAEWFLYFGDELPTSREFCIERHGKYFHKHEVEAWASLNWAGKMKDTTNEQTIFINAGGWRCQHSILPVTIDQVPRDVILRNISNGNFSPSSFEQNELNLPAA